MTPGSNTPQVRAAGVLAMADYNQALFLIHKHEGMSAHFSR
jgi:hypothetical protein